MGEIHVSRAGKNYGPYAADKAEAFYREGRLKPDDLVWKAGMGDWVPASELFAQVTPLPGLPLPVPPGADVPVAAASAAAPAPPKLHWALVLLFSILTLGIFFVVWMFVQTRWVRKIDPSSKATAQITVYLVSILAGQLMAEASGAGIQAVGVLLILVSYVVFYLGMYSMRRSLLTQFGGSHSMGLTVSRAMLFFFNVLYLQNRMTRIHREMTNATDR